MKSARTIGLILLGVWLVLTGAMVFIPAIGTLVSFTTQIMAALAILAGIFILIGKKS
jgi:hypothetical protein